MKYFAKKEVDNSFGGWYIPEIHETMFNVEIQENGDKIFIPKFDCVEYSEQEYNKFMTDVNKANSELRFDIQGRLVVYHKKPMPEGLIQGEYDYITETWTETLTLEEQLEYYKQEILKFNQELMIYEKSGFANEELQIKLDELLKKHNDIAYDIATQENKMLNL